MTAKQLDLDGVGALDTAARLAHTAWQAIMEGRRGNPTYRLTEEALADALRPAVAAEQPARPRAVARVNGRNPLFDALAASCGVEPPFTKSASGQVAKALKEIREIEPAVTAEELTRVGKEVRRKYENSGPMAVAAHWHEFAARHRKPAKVEEAGPRGWLPKLIEIYPNCKYAPGGLYEDTKETDHEWNRLDAEVRNAILEAMQ